MKSTSKLISWFCLVDYRKFIFHNEHVLFFKITKCQLVGMYVLVCVYVNVCACMCGDWSLSIHSFDLGYKSAVWET